MMTPPAKAELWDIRRFVIPVTALVCGIILAWRMPFGDPFLTFAFCGVFALHMFRRPGQVELAATLTGAALLSWARLAGFRWGDTITHGVTLPGISLGLSSLLVIAASTAWCAPEDRPGRLRSAAVALAIPFFVCLSNLGLQLTAWLHPLTYDGFLYAFDTTLGFEPSFMVGEFLLRARWLRDICEITYNAVPLLIAVVYALHAHRRKNAAGLSLLLSCGVAGVAGFLLYHLLPAAGPVYLFPAEFPRLVPAVPQLRTMGLANRLAPRDCMPSLHFAWALLLCWNARSLPAWVRVLTGAGLGLTALATLGSGQHYLVDLVVAVPFALAIQTACSPRTGSDAVGAHPFDENSTRRAKRRVVFMASATVVLWFGLLRFSQVLYQAHPATNWFIVSATVAASLLLKRSLARNPSTSQPASQRRCLPELVHPQERA